jgi:hypothetical protein
MAKSKETAVATTESLAHWPAMRDNAPMVLQRIKAILGPQLDEFAFEHLKTPTGGITSWTVRDLEEGEKQVKTIQAIILYQTQRRAYWQVPFAQSGGGSPPDCQSVDMVRGTGHPGGPCDLCPYSQFGSGQGGIGKACQEVRLLFVLTPEAILPKVIPAKPGSGSRNTPLFNYLVDTADTGYDSILTEFSLQKVSSKQRGLDFSQIVAKKMRDLSPTEIAHCQSLAHEMRAAFERVLPQQDIASS